MEDRVNINEGWQQDAAVGGAEGNSNKMIITFYYSRTSSFVQLLDINTDRVSTHQPRPILISGEPDHVTFSTTRNLRFFLLMLVVG